MDLKINCNAFVSLNGVEGVSKAFCEVLEYSVKNDTLRGNVKIWGEYKKYDNEKVYEFNDVVPFTVVFKNDLFEIENIKIDGFNYHLKDGQGIECDFDIIVDYYDNEIVNDNHNNEELVVDDKDYEIEETDEMSNDDITNMYNHQLDQILNESRDLSDLIEEELEEYSTELPYDNKLTEEDEIKEEKNITINSKEDKCQFAIPKINENKCCVKVYYSMNDQKLEEIAKIENVSLEQLLNNSENRGGCRRIIIKK